MTYSSGNTILAADYNGFVNTVNGVVGPSASYQSGDGYGDRTFHSKCKCYSKCYSWASD